MRILFGLFLFLILGSIAAALFTYSFFWYEASERPRRQALRASRKSPVRLMLYGIVSAVGSIILAVVLYPLGSVRSLWRPKRSSATQPAVVLVHGLYHNPSAWMLMKRRLNRAGFTNVYAFGYRSFFISFDAILKNLKEFVGRVPAASDRPTILVGHSLGGLICNTYTQDSDQGEMPSAVITLGAPWRGSKMAAFGIGGLAKSIGYGEPLFENIDREGAALPFRAAAIFSPADNLVLPPESLLPPPGWQRYETAPMSHAAMLYSKEVACKVIEIMNGVPSSRN